MKKIVLSLLFCISACFSQGWVNQTVVPPPPGLYSVSAFNLSTAWASGDFGVVLYTSNGGTNWVYRNIPIASNFRILGINAIGPQTALCVTNMGSRGVVFRTTNTGLSWDTVFVRNNVLLNDIKFINSATGYVYGNPVGPQWFFIRTTDGGNSFDTTIPRPSAAPPGIMGFPNALHVLFSGGINRIWFGTNMGQVIFSLNGGVNWNMSFTPNGNQFINAIYFLNTTNGFCSGNLPFSSNNSGISWVFQASYPNTGPFYSFTGISGYLWYSSGNRIYYSTNQGVNFTLQHMSPSNGNYRNLSFAFSPSDMSTITGWGVSEDGVISKYNDNTIGIQPISSQIPESFKLWQNYPNPFNPTTTIRFEIPEAGLTSLKIYDVLGNELQTLINEKLNAGVYESVFDGANYSSGVYFYKLASGNYTQVKKMIVVK
jgi:photosystem II stability/assembly factor-like uncharacterized protein